MYLLLILAGLALLLLFALFLPLPFLGSTKSHDIDLAVEAFHLENDQVVFDLGAGQGNLIFAAATEARKRKLNTVFYALEISFFAFFLLTLRSFIHPHRRYIRVRKVDIPKYNYEKRMDRFKSSVFYLYIPPWIIAKLSPTFSTFKKPVTVISYKYKLENREPTEKIQGQSALYVYKIQPSM